jgi:hypothetical protein
LRDPIGTVDSRTPWTDERTFEVQAKDPVLTANRTSRRDGGPHLLASIGDQRWKARRGAVATVRAGDGAHAVDRGLVIEENAASTIDLQIDEAGGQEGAGWKARLWPSAGNLAPAPKSNDARVPDQHGGFGMPAVTVKSTIRQDSMPVGD